MQYQEGCHIVPDLAHVPGHRLSHRIYPFPDTLGTYFHIAVGALEGAATTIPRIDL